MPRELHVSDSPSWSRSEMLVVAGARALAGRRVCFVGIGLPSAACNLARLTHAPAKQSPRSRVVRSDLMGAFGGAEGGT